MSQRKYSIKPMTEEQLTSLAEKFPRAVQTITIRRPVYGIIAKLLDCGVEVPGVELENADEPEAKQKQKTISSVTPSLEDRMPAKHKSAS